MSTLAFLDRIAEEKIRAAIERGDLQNLPGAGKPIPDEEDLALVPADLRMAYRVLKNAGHVPEEVRLRREIEDVGRLLDLCDDSSAQYRESLNRLHLLVQRLGEMRGGNLALHDRYYRQVAEKFARPHTTPKTR
ncbi:DnaJ family domain-containing protein [Methylocaldum sp. MU1018]